MILNLDPHFLAAKGYKKYDYCLSKIEAFQVGFACEDAIFIVVPRNLADGSVDYVPVFSAGRHSLLIRPAADHGFYVIN